MLLSIPFIKGDNCDNEHTKGEKLRPCNHCDHPLAFVWGCQKFTPERGNRLPWHGSAINRISHISSIVNASAGICRCGGSWAAYAARFEKGIFHALIGSCAVSFLFFSFLFCHIAGKAWEGVYLVRFHLAYVYLTIGPQFFTARTIPDLYWGNDYHKPSWGMIRGHCPPNCNFLHKTKLIIIFILTFCTHGV